MYLSGRVKMFSFFQDSSGMSSLIALTGLR